MELFAGLETVASLAFAMAVAIFAGFVKGVVGFSMPMILISGLTLVLSPEAALAALILPTLVTNVWQALRQGVANAVATIKQFRLFLIFGGVMLVLSAQLVRLLDPQVMLAVIGGPVALFAGIQLIGWRPRLNRRSKAVEAAVGGFTGCVGGISGVWGAPTVAYLTAIDTPKQEQMRAQGVIYGLGAVALAGAHVQTGVLRAETLPLTVMIVPFALVGMSIGFWLQDRIDQATFRKATLLVLFIAGLNLLRRALF